MNDGPTRRSSADERALLLAKATAWQTAALVITFGFVPTMPFIFAVLYRRDVGLITLVLGLLVASVLFAVAHGRYLDAQNDQRQDVQTRPASEEAPA
ncbi:MAG: hypothetical protein KY455_10980 [Euryarchaeota archaeon]|nr:hypothetical protein [Euryarchaeota archaeon]